MTKFVWKRTLLGSPFESTYIIHTYIHEYIGLR
jgi:hypothetical protein